MYGDTRGKSRLVKLHGKMDDAPYRAIPEVNPAVKDFETGSKVHLPAT